MSCVAEYRAAGVRRYYITLIMRACAKGGTGPRCRADVPRVPFPPSGKERRGCDVEAGRNGTRRSGELP